RFSGLGPCVAGTAMVKERRGAELYALESFAATRGLTGEVAALAHASYVVELARELLPVREPEPEVFRLLDDVLSVLGEGPLKVGALRRFELKLLAILGHAPVLGSCAGCGGGRLDEPGQCFDPVRGGVVCAACAPAHRGALPLGGEARAYLLMAERGELPEAEPEVAEAARDAVLSALTSHLSRPLKSLEFIAKVSRARRPG
ncbi:MAG TPA: DNA repair protein RecO, partial [Gemmatimonadales bacterium]|nr:DNA repair protein RecO [Gemmatimonadales bacterium]